jgi:hypothetical protein
VEASTQKTLPERTAVTAHLYISSRMEPLFWQRQILSLKMSPKSSIDVSANSSVSGSHSPERRQEAPSRGYLCGRGRRDPGWAGKLISLERDLDGRPRFPRGVFPVLGSHLQRKKGRHMGGPSIVEPWSG